MSIEKDHVDDEMAIYKKQSHPQESIGKHSKGPCKPFCAFQMECIPIETCKGVLDVH